MRYIVIFLLIQGCKDYIPPKVELCITGENNKFICQDEVKDYEVNYLVISPSDYGKVYNYCSDMREELIKLKRN